MAEEGVDETALAIALAAGRLTRRLRVASTLSHQRLSALSVIVRTGPLRLGELAEREGSSAPGMSRIVAELEARGLVERRPDPEDGRSSLVATTAEGERMLLSSRAERADLVARLLAELPPADRAALEAAVPALTALAAASERAGRG